MIKNYERFTKQQIKEYTDRWLAVDTDRASYFDPAMFEYAFLSGMMTQLNYEQRMKRTESVHDKGIVSDLRNQYPIKEEK